MFTGIVEELGIVRSINRLSYGAFVFVECHMILDDLKIGDSVSVNGVCQTVVKLENNGFAVDVSQETIDISTFKYLETGLKVNLERAMKANGRFGGHIVLGHVDGTGKFIKKINQGVFELYYFSTPDEIARYMIFKGSICVDGISLTIASLEDNVFSVAVIPQTSASTNLSQLKCGDYINLESDIFAKYIEKFVSKSDNTTEKITYDYLKEHGFM
ncbi:MAG: riboflavin synthase [Candidatus Gastranaerophilales bacterium]|nr:riboflavin synthase [Candidatus Gastranaerophilales bacterium]